MDMYVTSLSRLLKWIDRQTDNKEVKPTRQSVYKGKTIKVILANSVDWHLAIIEQSLQINKILTHKFWQPYHISTD